VGTPRVDATTITIPVDESARFTIGAVTATGELIGDEQANLATVCVRSGNVFSRTMIMKDRESLIADYKDHGYPNASVGLLSKVDRAHNTIDLELEIARHRARSPSALRCPRD
jgi:outer membrane protein assembly factor BamA